MPDRQPPFRNPLFRTGLLLSLLRGEEWYERLGSPLVQRPWPFFIRSEQSPRHLPWFWADAERKVQEIETEHKTKKEMHRVSAKDPSEAPAPELSLLIHRLVRAYLLRRTEERSQMKWEDFKDKKKTDEQGRERIDIPLLVGGCG